MGYLLRKLAHKKGNEMKILLIILMLLTTTICYADKPTSKIKKTGDNIVEVTTYKEVNDSDGKLVSVPVETKEYGIQKVTEEIALIQFQIDYYSDPKNVEAMIKLLRDKIATLNDILEELSK